jgi:hypothetical protein
MKHLKRGIASLYIQKASNKTTVEGGKGFRIGLKTKASKIPVSPDCKSYPIATCPDPKVDEHA